MIVFWTIFLSVSDRTEYICGCEKSIIKSAFVAACIAVAGYAAYHSQNEVKLSELAVENVEALAVGESNRGCTSDRNAICETSHNDYVDYEIIKRNHIRYIKTFLEKLSLP